MGISGGAWWGTERTRRGPEWKRAGPLTKSASKRCFNYRSEDRPAADSTATPASLATRALPRPLRRCLPRNGQLVSDSNPPELGGLESDTNRLNWEGWSLLRNWSYAPSANVAAAAAPDPPVSRRRGRRVAAVRELTPGVPPSREPHAHNPALPRSLSPSLSSPSPSPSPSPGPFRSRFPLPLP